MRGRRMALSPPRRLLTDLSHLSRGFPRQTLQTRIKCRRPGGGAVRPGAHSHSLAGGVRQSLCDGRGRGAAAPRGPSPILHAEHGTAATNVETVVEIQSVAISSL
jgi:hypothetical protein